MEQPGFFQRGGVSLFAVRHAPAGTARPLGFVMSHPFGEEKLWSHRVFVSFARELASQGYPVLRFDYAGSGDSGGSLGTASVDTHIADLEAAVLHLADKCPALRSIGLVGLRFGATIAALTAERASGRISELLTNAPLALWDPVLDGEAWLGELLRSHLSTQMAVYGRVVENRDSLRERIGRGECVNLDGYELAAPLYDSCNRKDLLNSAPKTHGGLALVMQIAASETQKNRTDLDALSSAYPRGQFKRCIEEPFWKEIRTFYGRAPRLSDATHSWLEQAHAATV